MSVHVQELASTVGVAIEHQLAGGLWGAYLGRSRTGAEVVIKVLPQHPLNDLAKVQRAVLLADSLRLSGYPVPRYQLVEQVAEHVITVQDFVRGTTPEVFGASHAEQLIDLWRRHRSAAGRTGEKSDPLAAVRSEDAPDCREVRNSADPAIRRLYGEARAVIEQSDPAIFRSGDIVHHDFHHRNFLSVDGRVVAVIDWEGATVGDSRVDLCELAWASRPGSPTRAARADQITSAAVAVEVEPAVAAAIAAGRAVEKIAFGLRTGEATLAAVLGSVHGYLRPQWAAMAP